MASSTPVASTPQYRPDVDGLRAVAVLSVIVFHINKALLPGGFVGVDVFFVISGFLISHHILRDVELGSFSLAEFYRRRIKRIMPPMLVIVGVTVVVAQWLLLPADAATVAKSGLWSIGSLANVYFWLFQDTGYFAAASNEKPLLHLWSLGVEEHFYLVWPLLLLLVYRRSRATWLFVVMTVVAIGSFALGQLLFEAHPGFVYYMLPTRAGELLLGALVALLVLRGVGQHMPGSIATLVAVVGCASLAASLWMLSEDSVFPGIAALAPTGGTALMILAGQSGDNIVSRTLALKPLVWVGLVSYSAYLWHWPLLAFFRYGHREMSVTSGCTMFILTMALAWASYLYVERPSRRSNASAIDTFLRQFAAPSAALAVLMVGAIAVDGYGVRWFSNEYKTSLESIHERTLPANAYEYVCQHQRLTPEDLREDRCVVGADSTDRPQAILWGDSNASHYVGMIGAFGKKAGFRFRNIAIARCPPIYGDPEPFVPSNRLKDCRDSTPVVRDALGSFNVVIMSATWTDYQESADTFASALFDTAQALARSGKFVVLIGKAPVIPGYDRLCREKALSYPGLTCPAITTPLLKRVEDINHRLRAFAESTPNMAYFDVTPYLCPAGLCSAFDAAGNPIYYDPDHLALKASWELGDRIIEHEGVPIPFARIASMSNSTQAVP